MADCNDWIDQFLEIESADRRERAISVLARTIYPTPWGAHTKPDVKGISHIKRGYPKSARGYAEKAFKAIDKEFVRG